jgi:nicotinate-nucleotide adenylyltransferase
MEIPGLDISSSMIRERLAAGLPVRYLVPDAVCQLIEKTGQYRVPHQV